MEYKQRIADDILKFKLDSFGGVLIVGPKGCGKTTTAKQLSKTVIEFQDEDKREGLLQVANTMPSKLLNGEKPILFDEWQDAPKIWGSIRKSIDDKNKNGLYILTGSTSQEVKVHHTGTTRISTMMMYPMSLFESGESNGTISLKNLFDGKGFNFPESNLTINDLIFSICRGGWPRSLFNVSDKSKLAIAQDIFYQTCNSDLSNISHKKRNPLWVDKILKSYSRNICTLASSKTLFSDASLSTDIQKTAYYEYIGDLQKLFIIEDINAWCPAIRSKDSIRSSPKRNFIDPSIAVAALGISPKYFDTDFKTLGFLFESLCIRDLKIYSSALGGQVSYYHDRYGLEADAVLHLNDGRYALIEFKLGEGEIEDGAIHLCEIEKLIRIYNEKETQCPLRLPDLKIIITGSRYSLRREDGVYVIPIGCLRD